MGKRKVSHSGMKVDRLFFHVFFFLTCLLFSFLAKMTTKFNQELYAWMKAKKNEPLSSIDQRRLMVIEKDKEKELVEKGLSTSTIDERRPASPSVSI